MLTQIPQNLPTFDPFAAKEKMLARKNDAADTEDVTPPPEMVKKVNASKTLQLIEEVISGSKK